MIENSKITTGLLKILKPYDPEKVNTALPQTMRQFLERDSADADEPQSIRLDDFSGGYQSAPVPVILKPRKYQHPVECKNYSRFYPLILSFWKWLKKHRQTVNIDHPLSNKTWPIMERLATEIEKQTGYSLSNLFEPYGEWEMAEDDISFERCFLPLYYAGSADDEVNLIAMLEHALCYFHRGGMPSAKDMPEVVAERAGERIDLVADVYAGILKKRKFALLGKNWERALKCLSKYKGDSISYFEMENEIDVDDMELVFEYGRIVHDMRQAVDPLMDEFSGGSLEFWNGFVERIYDIEKKYPQIKIKRRAEAKIAIKV